MWDQAIVVLQNFIGIGAELILLFLGISFLINLLEQFIPYDKLDKLLFTKNQFLANFYGAVLGFVTPFCSCSTIPLLVNMLNRKVPFQTCMTFLFTSPLLNPWVLGLMSVLLGWEVTVTYALVTFIFSMVIGWALERLGFASAVRKVRIKGGQDEVAAGLENSKKIDFRKVFSETFSLFRSVYLYLLAGAFIGALIKEVIPTEFITNTIGGEEWWMIPVAAVIGVPLYIRLSSMLPISQALMVKGMALGPLMALLIGGAGASLPEITMLKSIFRNRLVFAFMTSVFLMATFSGLLFHIMY